MSREAGQGGWVGRGPVVLLPLVLVTSHCRWCEDAVPEAHAGGAGPVLAAGPVAMLPSPQGWHQPLPSGSFPP